MYVELFRKALRPLVALGLLAVVLAGRTEAGPTGVPIISEADMRHSIGSHKGRVVLLHVWASWCLPCLEELPLVTQFAREMKPRGLEVVSISLDPASPSVAAKVGRVLRARGAESLQSRIVRVENIDEFVAGVDPKWDGGIPAVFAYDRQGKLSGAITGEATRGSLDRLVAQLLARR